MAEQQDTPRYQSPPQTTGPARTDRPAVEGVGVREAYVGRELAPQAGASVAPRVSWGALFAGFFAAIVIQVLLLTLGAAVGLSATGDVADAFGPGMGIWWVITSLIALFVGGYVAGRLMYLSNQPAGAMHGFLVFALTIVLGTMLLTTAGGALTGGIIAATPGLGAGQQQQPIDQQAPPPADPGAEQALPEQIGDITQGNLTAATWWAFIAMLLGGAAAIAGGWMGAPAAHHFGRRR